MKKVKYTYLFCELSENLDSMLQNRETDVVSVSNDKYIHIKYGNFFPYRSPGRPRFISQCEPGSGFKL